MKFQTELSSSLNFVHASSVIRVIWLSQKLRTGPWCLAERVQHGVIVAGSDQL